MNTYSKECDIWSAGMILHAMLRGTLPFNYDNNKETIRLILAGKVNFNDKYWD